MAKKKTTKTEPEEKNPVGRPKKYKTPQVMQKKIDEYFKTKYPYIEDEAPPTIGGLVEYLDFVSYQSLAQYEDYPEFNGIVIKAKNKCGTILNEMALLRKVDGRIASLNLASNHNLHEKKELVGEGGSPLLPSKIEIEIIGGD